MTGVSPAPGPAAIGVVDLVVLGISAVIGAGVFVITGVAAADYAGPAITLSFAIAAVLAGLIGWCFFRCAQAAPDIAGAPAHIGRGFGPAAGLLAGWVLIVEFGSAIAVVAVGWSGYVRTTLASAGLAISPAPNGGGVNLPAMAVIIGLSAVALLGLRQSVRILTVMVIVKLGVIVLLLGAAAPHIRLAMLVPFLPANSGSFGHFGWSGVLRGTVVAFSAYLGFDVIAALAPRSAQPARHFAIAIAIVLSLSAALYIATALVVTGIVPLPDLAAADPILRIIPAAGGALDWLGPWIAGGAILGLTSVLLSLLVAVPRMLSSLAREAGIGAFASDRNALFAVALGSAAVAGFCPIDRLAELISVSALLLFGGVAARAWQLGRGLVPLLSLAVTLLFLAVAPPAALAWTALSIAAGAAAGLVAAKVNMRALQRRAVAD